MESERSLGALVDYEDVSSSDEEQPGPIEIRNGFFGLERDDQEMIDNIFHDPEGASSEESDSEREKEVVEHLHSVATAQEGSHPSNSKEAILTVHNAGVSDPQPSARQVNHECDQETIIPVKLLAGGKKYAVDFNDLSPELNTFLKGLKAFFTKAINIQRCSAQVGHTTMDKVLERIRCYLGYLCKARNISPRCLRDETVFTEEESVQAYLGFLQDERGLLASTISCHANSILYAAKYLHKESGPSYNGVRFIAQLRTTATALQKQGDYERPSTTEELKAMDKWLSWDEILEAVENQKRRVELAIGSQKSCCLKELILMAVYCYLPPSRALEVRSLRYFDARDQLFVLNDHKGKNVVVHESSGDFNLHIQDFKTKKFRGYDHTSIEVGTELNRLLTEYISHHREVLLKGEQHDFVFVNSLGKPYSPSSFSKALQSIFYRLTGQKVSVHTLRSSFVTYAYSQSNCTDTLKDSIASALRHSRHQSQKVYDKRTVNQKKAEAVSYAQELAEKQSEHDVMPAHSEASPTKPTDQTDTVRSFPLGAFVGLAESNSSLNNPKILIGRVLSHKTNGEVSLLHYIHVKAKNYKLSFDGSTWSENSKSMVLVKMEPSKKMPDHFVLCTSLRAIHRQIFSE